MEDGQFDQTTRLITTRASRRFGFGAFIAGFTLPLPAAPSTARKAKRCRACRKGTIELSNGTCAVRCGGDSGALPGGCDCGGPSIEGQKVRLIPVSNCASIPRACQRTKDCPRGQLCFNAGCPGSATRCLAVCAG